MIRPVFTAPAGAPDDAGGAPPSRIRAAAAVLSIALSIVLAAADSLASERKPRTNYILRCSGCHALDGSGHPVGGIPDFRGLVGAFMGSEEGRTYIMHVPGVVGSSLTDAEIAGVMNFVVETWAGVSVPPGTRPFTAKEVARLRAVPVADVVAYRRAMVAALSAKGIKTAEYPWP